MTDQDVEPEFKQLFIDDALAKLNKMGEQLLELEGNSNSTALLTSLGRDAHSLKGAAGMVGFNRVASVCHAMENPLQQLKSGGLKLTPAVTDSLLAVIDGLRSLVRQSMSDDSGAKNADLAQSIISRLAAGAASGSGPPTAPIAPAADRPSAEIGVTAGVPESAAPVASSHGPDGSLAPASASSTMQIAVQRLDQIDRLVTESAAAHLRMGLVLTQDFKAEPESLPQYRELARLLGRLQEVTMRARMVPLATITPSLHRAVRDIAHFSNKQVRWEVVGDDTEIDRKVLELLLDPLVHLVRNSVDHGIETAAERVSANKPAEGVVSLTGMQRGSEIVLSIKDDGHGIDVAKVRAVAERAGIDTSKMSETEVRDLIFRSGLSTAAKITEISGRGVGLDVVRSNLQLVRGHVDVTSQPGIGTEFTITVPITLTIVECLMVESAGQTFAIPMHAVVHLLPPDTKEQHVGGRAMVNLGEAAVPLDELSHTLELGGRDPGPVVVVASGNTTFAIRVGRLVGHRDLVIKGIGALLPRNEVVAGAAIEPDGAVVVVLDMDGIAARVGRIQALDLATEPLRPAHKPSILVVDDALTVRELERSILERSGYSVRTAANGQEAMELLLREPSDLVLTDFEMPVMDGFALIESIRQHPRLSQTPIVILTSHASEPDRQRGLAAGASAYIIKSGFDQHGLLSLVEKLLMGGQV